MIKIDVLKRISLSKLGTKFYRFATDPKNENFFNNTLPTMETVLSTSCYVWATHKQNIDERQKHMLQVQNVLSGVLGIVIGSWANRKVTKIAEKNIPYIDKNLIPDVHKVVGGLKVALPIVTTGILMRLIAPVITAWISGKVEDRRYSKKETGLDIKA